MTEDLSSLAELDNSKVTLIKIIMNHKTSRRLTYTILSISLLTVMAGAAMAPALGVIREHFSGQSRLAVQLIVSLPALFIILTNLMFSPLCRIMKTKTLAVTGLCMYVMAGSGAFFIDDMHILLVSRALLGISVGMVMPLSTGLLAYYFPPEEQARMMGLSAAMNQMGGVVATFLSGVLAGISWNCSFLVYLLGLIALALVIAFLPNERLDTGEKALEEAPDYYESESGITKARKKPGRPFASILRFAPSVIGMFLVMCLFFIYPTNFAITSLANPSLGSNTITLIMVGLDIVGFIIGLSFGKIISNLRKQMKYIAPLGFLAGYVFLSFGTALPLLISGSVFIGIANGVGVPYLNTIASVKGGKNAATTVMPIISASLYLGQFLSPLIVNPCSMIAGGMTAPYKAGVILSVIFLIQTFCSRKYQTLPPARKNSENVIF